jgi:hypothetical protein
VEEFALAYVVKRGTDCGLLEKYDFVFVVGDFAYVLADALDELIRETGEEFMFEDD